MVATILLFIAIYSISILIIPICASYHYFKVPNIIKWSTLININTIIMFSVSIIYVTSLILSNKYIMNITLYIGISWALILAYTVSSKFKKHKEMKEIKHATDALKDLINSDEF